MTRTGSVNYHIHTSDRQAFELDAGGVVGCLISPELVATQVSVSDLRAGDVAVRFDRDSVAFTIAPSQVSDFDGDGFAQTYDRELTDLLTDQIGAKDVVVFDHTLRQDDPHSDRKPARNVHSDYSPEGAQKRLVDILGPQRAAQWAQGHYAFVNVWRPIGHPINSAPLGFIRPSSVGSEDWVLIDLIYPDRRGQILGLTANANHEWLYQSKMTQDEVAYFNIYDNRGLASIGHSAIDLIEDANVTTIRKSIESRTLIRY